MEDEVKRGEDGLEQISQELIDASSWLLTLANKVMRINQSIKSGQ